MADAGPLASFLKDIDPVPSPHPAGTWLINNGLGWVVPGAIGLWILPTPDAWIPGWLALCFVAAVAGNLINTVHRQSHLRRSVQRQLKERLEEWLLIEELNRFERERTLTERIDPRLTILLNRAVLARQQSLASLALLKSSGRLMAGDGAPLAETLPLTTASAIVDACWIGRHLIRRSRQRKASFEKRTSDPSYQKAALVAIHEMVIDMELLAESLKDGAGLGETTVREALGRLKELKDAWSELDPPVQEASAGGG